jgi:phage baseplate assembly protein W
MARDFLGKDTKFPIVGRFQPVKGVDTVVQDLQILIATVPGERVNRPAYGCRLYTRVWDNIDTVARDGLTDIRAAIEAFEPRVQLISLSATINRDLGSVDFRVVFRIIDSNVVTNLVFPFQTQVSA